MDPGERLHRPRAEVVLRHPIDHPSDRTEFQRAVITEREGVYWAQTTGLQVSGRLRSLVGANGLLVLPAGRGHFDRGDVVTAILLDRSEVKGEEVTRMSGHELRNDLIR